MPFLMVIDMKLITASHQCVTSSTVVNALKVYHRAKTDNLSSSIQVIVVNCGNSASKALGLELHVM